MKEGAEPGGAKYTELALPTSQFGDPTAVAQAIKGALLQDTTIDAHLHPRTRPTRQPPRAAIDQAGLTGKVSLGGPNFDTESLDRIKGGTQLFAIDQQGLRAGLSTRSRRLPARRVRHLASRRARS